MHQKRTQEALQRDTAQHTSTTFRKADAMLITSVGPLVLFGPLAWWIHGHPILAIDVTITRALQKHRHPFIKRSVGALSGINSQVFLNGLTFLTGWFLWKKRFRLEGIMLIGSTLGADLLRLIIQRVVNRPRPRSPLVHVMAKNSQGKSFPSGHVLESVTFWGWLLVLKHLLLEKGSKWKEALARLPLLFLAIIGPARIYLGEHWASDVLGGYLIGSSWLGVSLRLYIALRDKGILSNEEVRK